MSAEKSGFEGERIAKAIARAGVCSRRDAEAMILEGRVSVNGKKLTSPALNVTDSDDIRIDGKPLPAAERTRLFRYYKPRGLVTTAKDPQGRPTVFDSLPPGMPRVISVGRLDLNSEGLLLLTNDGALARRLELPSTGWVRRYRVRVHGEVDQAQLTQLAKGITVEGVRYSGIEATFDRKQGDNVWLTMALTEGKNREIRNICGHFGWPVSRLIRIAYGPFQLGSHLNPGDIEEVPARVLREQLGQKQPVHKVSGQLKLSPKPRSAQAERANIGKPHPDKSRGEQRHGDKPRSDKSHADKPRGERRHKPKRHAH